MCGFKVNMGGTVDPKYYMPVLDVIDRNTLTKVIVRHRSSLKIEFPVTVPESTLRSLSASLTNSEFWVCRN